MARHKKNPLKKRTISITLSHPITSKSLKLEIEAFSVSKKSFLAVHPLVRLIPKGKRRYTVETDPTHWVITHVPTGMAVGNTIGYWKDRAKAEAYLTSLEGPEWDFDTLDGMTTAVYQKFAKVHSELGE